MYPHLNYLLPPTKARSNIKIKFTPKRNISEAIPDVVPADDVIEEEKDIDRFVGLENANEAVFAELEAFDTKADSDSDIENKSSVSHSDFGSDFNSELDSDAEEDTSGWHNKKVKRTGTIKGPAIPATQEEINYFLEHNQFPGFDAEHIKITGTKIIDDIAGKAFRSDATKETCYISFRVFNRKLEITHFECRGGGKELLYDMIIELFKKNYFFDLVELEASPWINVTKENTNKNGKIKGHILKKAQQDLNTNYESMGLNRESDDNNFFAGNVVDVLLKLREFVRNEKGGSKRKTRKARKSIKKNNLKKHRKSIKKNRRRKSIKKNRRRKSIKKIPRNK